MYYMNTDRDNFHDWHRDKPDTTAFSELQSIRMPAYGRRRSGTRWGRLAFIFILVVVVVVGIKYFVKL
jgi:hypothetical protein